MYFDPCDYGDPYTKKTCLWGDFIFPEENPVEPEFVILPDGKRMSKKHYETFKLPRKKRTMIRSITPLGFAKAFFKANQ